MIPWAFLGTVYNPVQSVGDIGDNGKFSHKVTKDVFVKSESKAFHVGS